MTGEPPATPATPATAATPATPRRRSAAERREEILAIAVRHFAEGGYRGTSTEAIAREAGISQPYLFQLFHTKRDLFVACADRACSHVGSVFRRAAVDAPDGERLQRMGLAYVEELLPDRHAVLLLMQAFAAVADPDIQARVRARYGELVGEVTTLAGVTPPEALDFFAKGMLLNIITALDAWGEPWAEGWRERG
jgi:AcrR family transcriptional regulator